MKVKEKLADEYVRSTGMVIHSPVLAEYLEAKEHFIAGFEKCRDIAAEMMEPYDCDIQEEMKELGEEEVKE